MIAGGPHGGHVHCVVTSRDAVVQFLLPAKPARRLPQRPPCPAAPAAAILFRARPQRGNRQWRKRILFQ